MKTHKTSTFSIFLLVVVAAPFILMPLVTVVLGFMLAASNHHPVAATPWGDAPAYQRPAHKAHKSAM